MKTTSLRQSASFPASPHEMFELLMDAKKHAAFTGGEAAISRKVGGKFTTFDGWAEGKNLELVLDKKIVQTWRNSDWPEGHYSTITFELRKTKDGTRLTFTQTDLPSQFAKAIAQGWKDYYWEPMREMLTS